MTERLIWERDGPGWPNHAASRFVSAGGLRWHVQMMGEGPILLLLHGTGAATHSWRTLAPILSRRFTVVAPDMPGHGFTEAPLSSDMSIVGMSRLVGDLVATLDVKPRFAVGHSAGAAILCRMSLDGAIEPDRLVSLNGALLPFPFLAGRVFSPMAKMMFWNPVISVPRLFAWLAADRSVVERTLRGAGSHIDRQGIDCYAQLFRDRGHVTATLAMMAHWDLKALRWDLPRLQSRLILITAKDDRAIPPRDAFTVRDIVPGARVVMLRRGGHLLHEERPHEVGDLLIATMSGDQTDSPSPSASQISGMG